MDKFLNFSLLSRPENWLIIWLILYLSALLARIVYEATLGVNPVQSLSN